MPDSVGTNAVYLVGRIAKAPEYCYDRRGYHMYEGLIDVPRRSGACDRLPFILPRELIGGLVEEMCVALSGSMHHRDRHRYPDVALRLAADVDSISPASPSWCENRVELSGNLCMPPKFRTTPFGREVCELTIAIPNGYGPQENIFCIAWGGLARFAANLSTGAAVHAEGRFQSRPYVKALPDGRQIERTALEVSLYRLTDKRRAPV